MDLFTLGEYAIKVALEVGRKIKTLNTTEVDSGIAEAYKRALSDWSQHAPTSSDELRLNTALDGYIKNATSYEALNQDTKDFIDCFKKRLSEQPAAHNYLMTLRADEQANSEELNLQEHRKTQESILGLKDRMEELNMAPQYVRALLKELPLEQGLERTESTLEEMLTNGRIHSEGAKCLIAEFVRFLFEHTDKITEEAIRLRVAGDSYLAETLEEIKKVLTGESEQSLTAVHEKYLEQARQGEIKVLKELIDAAQITLSFMEARGFYERLIELAPTTENHFNYARMLQSLNDFEEAISHYEAVLQLHQELSDHNTEAYKLSVVTTLNNLGILLCQTNEFKRAQDCYQEVLQIYQDLSKQNPEAYKPNTARTLNNLGNLFKKINEHEQAKGYYKRALKIRRQLARQNPEIYKSEVAETHNNLGNLLKNTHKYKEARSHYIKALRIYRKLEELSPDSYKPSIARVLNNLGNLLCNRNKHRKSRPLYEEALRIYRTFEELNPEAYQPKVAMTLSNLADLYINLKETEAAEKAYQEALDIYRELAILHPRAYEINYTRILVMGVVSLDKPEENLEEAKAILNKYPEHPEAQGLLSSIEEHSKRVR
ncbi:MAG: tetratricopeptide repeat protein [Porphyromonas pasteri]